MSCCLCLKYIKLGKGPYFSHSLVKLELLVTFIFEFGNGRNSDFMKSSLW